MNDPRAAVPSVNRLIDALESELRHDEATKGLNTNAVNAARERLDQTITAMRAALEFYAQPWKDSIIQTPQGHRKMRVAPDALVIDGGKRARDVLTVLHGNRKEES